MVPEPATHYSVYVSLSPLLLVASIVTVKGAAFPVVVFAVAAVVTTVDIMLHVFLDLLFRADAFIATIAAAVSVVTAVTQTIVVTAAAAAGSGASLTVVAVAAAAMAVTVTAAAAAAGSK